MLNLQPTRPLPIRLLMAFAIVAVTLSLRIWLLPIDAKPALIVLSPAVMLCFLLCGTLPGIVATAVSAASIYYVFIPPRWSFVHKPDGELAVVLFLTSSLIVGLIDRGVRARERALERLTARQNAVLDSELLGVAIMRERRVVWGNSGLEKLLGYGPGELVGLPTRKGYPDDETHDAVGAAAYPILKAGGTYRGETVMVTKSGARIRVDQTGSSLAGSPGESLWLFADVTSRRLAEDTARASEERYRLLAENANDMIATMAPDSTVLFVTPAVRRVLGYSPDEVVGRKTLDLTHPDDVPHAVRTFTKLMSAGPGASVGPYEFRGLHKDGRWVWLEGQPRIELDEFGNPVCFQDVLRDIDSRKRMEAELRTSQSFLARTSQVAGIGGWEHDVDSGLTTWSDETCRLLDRPSGHRPTLEEGIAHYAPEARPLIAEAVREGVATGRPWDMDLAITSAKGRTFLARVVGAAEYEGGRVVRLVGAFQDVSEARRLARDAAESHELLKVTLASIGDAVITTGADSKVSWMNPVAERLTGWLASRATGLPLATVFAAIDQTTRALTRLCAENCESEPLPAQATLISATGTERGVEGTISPLRDAEGALVGKVLVFRDVTEQRRLGKELAIRASRDPLTGLLNRTEFDARLEKVIAAARQDDEAHALLFIDLDRFKLVNDIYGHAEGDRLLCRIGAMLCDGVRNGRDNWVARLGGDEFGVVLSDCDLAAATLVAREICDGMKKFQFEHDGASFHVGASIGVVQIQRGATAADTVHGADMACYEAKRAGRNRVRVGSGASSDEGILALAETVAA